MDSTEQKGLLKISVPNHHVMSLTVEHFNEHRIDKSNPLMTIDVRTHDFAGGFIPGAIHMPYPDFDSKHLSILIQQCQEKKIARIVFYCMYSTERAPACAQTFLSTYEHLHPHEEPPAVFVLDGGMCGYVNWMIGHFDPGMWVSVVAADTRRIIYRGDLDNVLESLSKNRTTPKAAVSFNPLPSGNK